MSARLVKFIDTCLTLLERHTRATERLADVSELQLRGRGGVSFRSDYRDVLERPEDGAAVYATSDEELAMAYVLEEQYRKATGQDPPAEWSVVELLAAVHQDPKSLA